MSEVLCLANSYKEKDRCVAGIELSTGKFVRPVSKTKSQAVPKEWTLLDSKPLEPLEIVDVPFLSGNARVRYQAENQFCCEGWKRIGNCKPHVALKYCESAREILHTPGSDAIPERFFKLCRLPEKH